MLNCSTAFSGTVSQAFIYKETEMKKKFILMIILTVSMISFVWFATVRREPVSGRIVVTGGNERIIKYDILERK